jgi:maltose/maltodextrin transport system permease protein
MKARNSEFSAWMYLLPALAAMFSFIAFPLLYTAQLSTTNYSSSHLLGEDGARNYLLSQAVVDGDKSSPYTVHMSNSQWTIRLYAAAPQSDDLGAALFETASFVPNSTNGLQEIVVKPVATSSALAASSALNVQDRIKNRDALANIRLKLPDGTVLRYAGLREFSTHNPLFEAVDSTKTVGQKAGSILETRSKKVFSPNQETGFFEASDGEKLQPGYRVGVGANNYVRLFSDSDIRGPFISIFIWTVAFAGLTVFLCTCLGMALAVVLEWPAIRGKSVYRALLFLPYAVPGFISILVFKGLFNQNFGEINTILNALFGIKPAWFADQWLARLMLLIVNTWLGYPYIMILCSGLLKSISADLYEASAIAGAKPLTNFFKITLPLVIKPLTPLLIAAFAFNFNNFVLISLLTDGRPDFLNTKVPAGTNDILVSYTYRIAFTDAGQNFGFAAAISTLIFILVALMSWWNLKVTRQQSQEANSTHVAKA